MLSQINKLRIAIVGATGAVGRVALDLLLMRNYPAKNIIATASASSVGKTVKYGDEYITVEPTNIDVLSSADVVFISATNSVSSSIGTLAAKNGSLVIDDSSVFRMSNSVPLVVPEVNGEDVLHHSGIISIPNCSTTPLVMVLAALRSLARVDYATVATYQSISGAGVKAQTQLIEDTKKAIAGVKGSNETVAFNAIPKIGDFTQNRFTQEEVKMSMETCKILHDDKILISATCVRVPVNIGHSLAVHIGFDSDISSEDARRALEQFPGVSVLDSISKNIYPTPITSAGYNDVFVGRIRVAPRRPNMLLLWLCCDNLLKGAALNAIQILDEVIKRKCLNKQR